MSDYGGQRSSIINCDFDFGVGVEEQESGRARIFVRKDIISPGYDGPAIRASMEEIAVAWLEQVAPQRLATLPQPEQTP